MTKPLSCEKADIYYILEFRQRYLSSGYETIVLILLRQQFNSNLNLLQQKFTLLLYIYLYLIKL